jgi:hypothetical protein
MLDVIMQHEQSVMCCAGCLAAVVKVVIVSCLCNAVA